MVEERHCERDASKRDPSSAMDALSMVDTAWDVVAVAVVGVGVDKDTTSMVDH